MSRHAPIGLTGRVDMPVAGGPVQDEAVVDVERELNWAGTYGYLAERIVRVASVDEARDLVTSGARIRPLGTRHSFNDVADGPGLLVDLTGLSEEVEIAADRRSATVSAGARYGVLAVELFQTGDAHGILLRIAQSAGLTEAQFNACEQNEAELVIVDGALSPIQQRNLEDRLKRKVIDRTGLILEIFGERAATAEGRLQVELALDRC